MKSILDHFSPKQKTFQPKTMNELFALHLAQKLDDVSAADKYVALVAEYSLEHCLAAYRRAARESVPSSLAARFKAELPCRHRRMGSSEIVRLLAIKVERRSIAAVVFAGRQPEYHQVRHLSSSSTRAQNSAVGFINWICGNLRVQSAAVECTSPRQDTRRAVLSEAVLENSIHAQELPVWPIPKQELLQGFGNPALQSRKELREVILSIWPTLKGSGESAQLLDAVALGSLVQTKRLFLH